MNTRTIFAILLYIVFANPALAGGDAEAGKAKSNVCAGCHGADGKAISPDYPNLAGQHAGYMARQLTDFRDGKRVDPIMAGMSAGLSDQDTLDLAAYYSAQAAIETVAKDENLQLGEDIYRGGVTTVKIAACSGCHGPAGMGNPAADFPRLGGQNAAYLSKQLNAFRSGTRNNDPNEMMRSIAHRLSDVEIAALANYISGLH